MYHATHRDLVETILREGLRPDPEYGDPVHLADEPDFAFSSAYIARDWEDYEIATLVVDVGGLTLGPGADGEGSHTFQGVIGPERLSRWTSPR